MLYYSTGKNAPDATLAEAVTRGLAPDRGLYMPRRIERLPDSFFAGIDRLSFHEIACRLAVAFFGVDIPREELDRFVSDSLSFVTPVV